MSHLAEDRSVKSCSLTLSGMFFRSWYDLVHAFPGLNRKLAKRMLPAAHSAVTDAEVDKVAAKATKPVYQDATVILDTADSKDVSSNGGARSVNQSPMVGVSVTA